jgi:hypothetical protein
MTNETGPLSGKEPTDPQGPRRRAPMYYVGETYGRRPINYPDVERYNNGAIAGIRDKAARRLIRGALKRTHSKVEKGVKFARSLKAQAVEVITDEHAERSPMARSRMARRLLAEELAIHQEVYVPSKKEIRKMRTQARAQKRRGGQDAIGKLVERMAGEKR